MGGSGGGGVVVWGAMRCGSLAREGTEETKRVTAETHTSRRYVTSTVTNQRSFAQCATSFHLLCYSLTLARAISMPFLS